MKRITGYALAALLVLGAASASAQTAVWTGDYYVVIGMSEKLGYAAAYGQHLKWNELKAGPNFEGGTFTDLTLAPMTIRPNERLTGRYEMLAVGTVKGRAVTVTGYEWANAPRFVDGLDELPIMETPIAAAWTGTYYVVLGTGLGGDGVLPTLRNVVAFGRPGAWGASYLPFDDRLTFTHLAAAISPADPIAPYEMLAVGTYPDGSAGATVGYDVEGVPFFPYDLQPIPGIDRPITVEWTGDAYVVVGESGNGAFSVAYGRPGAWSTAKEFTLDGGTFTSVAVAPRPAEIGGYDLLAVGALKGMAVSLPGAAFDGVPVFEHGCSMIPELLALGGAPAVRTEEADVLGAPYPNPFNPQASFTVTVAADQAVRVEVFNLLGQRVAVLHDGLLTGGMHAFTFDGGALPSGTYLLRAQGADFAQTRQLLLMK